MAKIILIQALPAPRLDSRENLARALTLLQDCQAQEGDLICFPEYFPFWGDEELSAAAEIAGRLYPLQDGRSFAIQPPAPVDNAALARQVRAWDDLTGWIVRCGGETEAIITVNLDLEGPRRWRPVIWERFGITG